MTITVSIDDFVCFEFVDEYQQRSWSIGKIRSVDDRLCTVTLLVQEEWGAVSIHAVKEQIDFLMENISTFSVRAGSDFVKAEGYDGRLQELTGLEGLKRRLQFLQKIEEQLECGSPTDIPGKCFVLSVQRRQICVSSVFEKVFFPGDFPYLFIDAEEEVRLQYPTKKNDEVTQKYEKHHSQKVKELKFFDSRWPWDPRWPTIVTHHSAFFPWPGFEKVLRYKPDETRNTFIAEAAFCCQVPLHCIIDTQFAASANEWKASFKVVHHPSVEPSELDVRISQHPFWSMTYLRDSNIDERKGLDRAARDFRRALGLGDSGDSGMYFSQFLDVIPRLNFLNERDAYESELIETLFLCDSLERENEKLRKLLNEIQCAGLDEALGVGHVRSGRRTTGDRGIGHHLRDIVEGDQDMTEEELIERVRLVKQDLDDITKKRNEETDEHQNQMEDMKEQVAQLTERIKGYEEERDAAADILTAKDKRIEELELEIQELLTFHNSEIGELEKELGSRVSDISDLLDKVEEMSVMLKEAQQGEAQALRLRAESDTEIFRLQKVIDSKQYLPRKTNENSSIA